MSAVAWQNPAASRQAAAPHYATSVMPDRTAYVDSAAPAPSRPTLSRRHEAGAHSARGLLLTVLGEFVLPAGGVAWTSAVLAALDRVGVAEKATRQALMRTSNAGWLTPEKVGRRTRWQLTRAARRLLTEGATRIYSFGPARDWDGHWVIVQARIPDSDRKARHVVRTRLAWAGYGSLGPGVWISPHTAREHEAVRVLTEAGVAADAHVFVARRTGLSDVRAMVAAAWNLPAVGAEYDQFVAEFGGGPGGPGDPCHPGGPGGGDQPRDVLARQLELVHAWRRFPSLDPSLPRELLPAQWSGTEAARLFAERHERWAPGARCEWERLNA